MKIKHASWYAAGPEVVQALRLLSDGAFKLYLYLCLHANRENGFLTASYLDLAVALGKSRRSIVTYSEELRLRGVCRFYPAMNQHRSNDIEIYDEFWPYMRSESDLKSPDSDDYISQIKLLLDARACVKCAFSVPDQKFAETLFARNVSLEQIERAIALGCSRKYVSLLNGADSGAIVSFSYFRDLIEEAGDPETPAGYWDYVKPQLKKFEEQWATR